MPNKQQKHRREKSLETQEHKNKNTTTDWANHVLHTKNFVSPAVNNECLKTFTFLKSVEGGRLFQFSFLLTLPHHPKQ